MILFFVGVVTVDAWLDGSLSTDPGEHAAVQGTLFAVMVGLLMIPANQEMGVLVAGKNLKIIQPVTAISSILLALSWYFTQLLDMSLGIYLAFVAAFSLMVFFLAQNMRFGMKNVVGNIGAGCFTAIYLGLLAGFAVAIRVDFGFWALIMFIFGVKITDIGAYFIGSAYGKHKFAPNVSPNKSWEGLAGGIISAAMLSVIISLLTGIISAGLAAIFGVLMAVTGQLGDCCESMIKRDAQAKDAANKVPGFGGILDLIDSPLAAGIFAYLYFILFL